MKPELKVKPREDILEALGKGAVGREGGGAVVITVVGKVMNEGEHSARSSVLGETLSLLLLGGRSLSLSPSPLPPPPTRPRPQVGVGRGALDSGRRGDQVAARVGVIGRSA